MSRLVPELITLDKGIDLQTAKIIAPKGSVLDSLNYEQVDFQGQKRIDGFSRYDGRKLATFDEYYVIEFEELFTGDKGDLLAVEGNVFAVVLSPDNQGAVAVAIINENAIPVPTDVIDRLDPISGEASTHYTVNTITLGVEWEVTPDVHYANLLAYHKVLRQNVEALPGAVAGLHWFKDRLYAVADIVAVSLDGTTPQIFPNDTLNNGVESVKVLDSFILQDTRLVWINSFDTEGLWQEAGRAVTRNSISVGAIASGFNYIAPEDELATFFESRSEQQVIDEADGYDYGWRLKDLGWKVNYEDGISLYGSFPSLNQNIDGLGTQGPTNITGNNGRPTNLVQNIPITNGIAQVDGWKSSQTPSTYNLDIDNLTDIDDVFIYADAYIFWDGTTGIVNSPGLTSSALQARPADSTVVIELP